MSEPRDHAPYVTPCCDKATLIPIRSAYPTPRVIGGMWRCDEHGLRNTKGEPLS